MTSERRVLVLIQGTLGERLAGPAIRAWEMVRALSTRHPVTAAANVHEPHQREGVPVIPRTRKNILAELRRHDVIVGPVLPPYALLAEHACLKVADLYDPVELELATVGGWRARRHTSQQRASRRLQLRWADVVLCANGRQRRELEAELAQVSRENGPPLLRTVPMGLPEAPSAAYGRPLRDRFAIGTRDPLVLWWGSVWRWLDARTAIEAVGLLAARRPNVRLVITAGRPSDPATDPLNATEEARALARRAGLLGRRVFFLDEWVPFNDRHSYLADADVGITLHAGTAEAPLAARARYMDYVWAALPSVLAEGDELAGRMARAGAARIVAPGDAGAAAAALDGLLDEQALSAARASCRTLADQYRWPAVLKPLVETVELGEPASRSLRQRFTLAGQAGRYYAGRVVDGALGTA